MDAAIEAYKAAVKPQWVTRFVPQVIEFAQRESTTVVSQDQQVVSYVIREATSWVIGLRPMKELANEPAVALKEFLASPVKGVPFVSGAVQGITDAFEPDLTTEQRAKRIAIAAVTAVAVAGVVALAFSEGIAAIAVGLVLNALIDVAGKPRLFKAWDLDPHKEKDGEGQPP